MSEHPNEKSGDEAPASAPADGSVEPPAEAGSRPPTTTPSAAVEEQPDPLAKAKQDHAELKDRYLRLAADYDNYRKRARRDVDEAEKKAREVLLKELLPVFDNLERAAASAVDAVDAKSVGEGVRMVLKQFVDTLDRAGIQRITSKGAGFDPMQHEAIQHLETDEHPPGAIVAEVQAGYKMGERLVRAALVVVAKSKPAPAEGGESEAS